MPATAAIPRSQPTCVPPAFSGARTCRWTPATTRLLASASCRASSPAASTIPCRRVRNHYSRNLLAPPDLGSGMPPLTETEQEPVRGTANDDHLAAEPLQPLAYTCRAAGCPCPPHRRRGHPPGVARWKARPTCRGRRLGRSECRRRCSPPPPARRRPSRLRRRSLDRHRPSGPTTPLPAGGLTATSVILAFTK